MDLVAVAATDGSKPVAGPSVDYAAVLCNDKGGMVTLEVLARGETESHRTTFEYLPSIYRFIDRASA